jgi:SpoVG
MEITEVTIEPVDEGDLRAHVSIVFDNCFAVHGLKIIRWPECSLLMRCPAETQAVVCLWILPFRLTLRPEIGVKHTF